MKRIFLIGLLSLAIPASADAHKLGYDGAKRAAQKRADHFAKARTEIKTLFRTSRHSYYAQGHWERTNPDGCKGCGYDPATGTFYDIATTESCFVELRVKFRSSRSRKVRATVTGHSCS